MTEWIRLKSTLVSLFNTRFLCSTCLERHPTQPDRLEQQRRQLGCYSEYPQAIHHQNGIEYSKCIGNFYSESAACWIEAYDQYEKGVMPYQGNYFEQPAKAIKTMRIIQAYKAQWLAEREQQQSRGKRGR